MEDLKEKTADLLNHAEELVDTWQKLALIKLTKKAADVVSSAATAIVLCTLALVIILLGGLALSWWLGDLVESRAGGFLLGALFFVIVAVIIFVWRKSIFFPLLRDQIVRKLYD